MQKNTLPFALGEYLDVATYSGLANVPILGQEYETADGKVYRCVRLNKSGGFVCAKKVFKRSDSDGSGGGSGDNWDVEPVSGTSDSPCGIGAAELAAQTVPDNAYFLVQIAGEAEVTLGDDSGDPAVGGWCDPDDDTDLGKIKTNTTNFTAGVSIGQFVEAASADGDTPIVAIFGKLIGR